MISLWEKESIRLKPLARGFSSVDSMKAGTRQFFFFTIYPAAGTK